MHASIHSTACLIALLGALLGSRVALAQGSRVPQDEIVYQIMPIAWRDSDNDKVGTVTTRFGDFGGEEVRVYPQGFSVGTKGDRCDQRYDVLGDEFEDEIFVDALDFAGEQLVHATDDAEG